MTFHKCSIHSPSQWPSRLCLDRGDARRRVLRAITTARQEVSDGAQPTCSTGCPSTESATVMFPRVAFE